MRCLSLIGEGFSREREWLPAWRLAAPDVELMSGSVSRVTRGATHVAVEVLREAGAVFLGEAPDERGSFGPRLPGKAVGTRSQTGWQPVTRPIVRAPCDDERDEADYFSAATSPFRYALSGRDLRTSAESARTSILGHIR